MGMPVRGTSKDEKSTFPSWEGNCEEILRSEGDGRSLTVAVLIPGVLQSPDRKGEVATCHSCCLQWLFPVKPALVSARSAPATFCQLDCACQYFHKMFPEMTDTACPSLDRR